MRDVPDGEPHPLGMHRRVPTLLCVPLLAVSIAGCGGGDPQTEQGAVDSIDAYFEAYNNNEYGNICDHWSEDYEKKSLEEWNDGFGDARNCRSLMKQATAFTRAFYELDDDEAIYEVDEITAEVDGDEATVEVTFIDDEPSTYGLAYIDGKWLIETNSDDAETGGEGTYDGDSDAPEASDEEQPEAAPDPSTIGDTVEVGDWSVTVVGVSANADPAIKKANQFNDSAQGHYVLVDFEATYNGDERTADASELTWTFTTSDADVLSEASAVTPKDSEAASTQVRSGGTVRGDAVFDVDPAVYSGGLLSVETYDDDYNTVFVDFAIE